MDFFRDKYKLKDLPHQQHSPVRHTPPKNRHHVEELRYVNPELVRSVGLGSIDKLKERQSSVLTFEQLLDMQGTQSLVSVCPSLLGQKLTPQQLHQAARIHGAAITI